MALLTQPASQIRTALKVRRYRPGDAAAVTALYRSAFPAAVPPGWTLPAFARHWEERPSGLPEDCEGIGPLVLAAPCGAVAGFLGVHPRPLLWRGRPIRGAVCSDLCVAASARGFGGALLLSAFLEGPQDFSFSDEGNESAFAIWTALGGSVLWLQSLRWTLPLRPARLALSALLRPPAVSAFYRALAPATPPADALARVLVSIPKPRPPLGCMLEPLRPGTLLGARSRVCPGWLLAADDQESSIAWKLRRLAALTQAGALRAFLVRDSHAAPAGWFIYYLKTRGLSDLIEIAGRPAAISAVFDALLHDAWAAGASGLTGRFEPHLSGILGRRLCFTQPNPRWMLVASRIPALLSDVLAGRAWLTRLDGEWTHHLPAADPPKTKGFPDEPH